MIIKGFKMKVFEGYEAEYEKRHREIWPEMRDMLKEHGCRKFEIFLDEETRVLFGYIEVEDEEKWAQRDHTEINLKWWDYMADIMETNPDKSPISIDLRNVFHME